MTRRPFARGLAAIVLAGANSIASADLVHHWKLDEATGPAIDTVGGANAARAGIFSSDPGKIAGGFRTDGVNHGFLNAGNVPLTGSFAISFWVNPANVSQDWRNMISKHDLANQRAFWIGQHANDGHMRFGLYFDGQAEQALDTTGAAVLANGQWSHVVAMWNEQTKLQSLFVNGQLAAAATRAGQSFLFPRSSNLLFNTNHTSNDPTINVGSWARFGGATDDVAIWDRPLTAGKVGAMTRVENITALAGYSASEYAKLFKAYDTAFEQQIGNRRWKHTTGLAIGEGHATGLPNGFAVQLDPAGGGVSSLNTVKLGGDPLFGPGIGHSFGSVQFPHQLSSGDVYVMLWLDDTAGGDDRAALRAGLEAVSGTTYDLILDPADPLWQQLAGTHGDFDTLLRFNQAGVVGAFNWDFAANADIRVTQTAVVTTGQIPEPAGAAALAMSALLLHRRGRR